MILFKHENGIQVDDIENIDLSLIQNEQELNIIKQLSEFPDVIEKIALNFSVHLLPEYLLNLAKLFHSYYHKHRVVSEDKSLTLARIALAKALLCVFSTALHLLNISLPDEM